MKVLSFVIWGIICASVQWVEAVEQTAEQIQEQKNLAGQMAIQGAPEEFRTPLKTFESFFGGIVRGDASEFRSLTTGAIMALFGHDLSDADRQRLREHDLARDGKDYVLIEFRFTADADRPKILFAYRYNYLNRRGERIPTTEKHLLVLTRTDDGWKIDEMPDL